MTELMDSSYNGHIEEVRELIERGVYINEKDNDKRRRENFTELKIT